jgi:hypothetical protein
VFWPRLRPTDRSLASHGPRYATTTRRFGRHCLAHIKALATLLRATTTQHNGQRYVYFPSYHPTCLSLTAVGEKRSADEADLATPDDGAKRRESPGTGKDPKRGPKVRVHLVVLTALGLITSHTTLLVLRRPSQLRCSNLKAHAVPLHVTVTDTPPTARDDNSASPDSLDQGILGTVALHPCTFTTKSYGWKGSRRLAIDIVHPVSGEKNKVQVMLSYVFLTIEFLLYRASESMNKQN